MLANITILLAAARMGGPVSVHSINFIAYCLKHIRMVAYNYNKQIKIILSEETNFSMG